MSRLKSGSTVPVCTPYSSCTRIIQRDDVANPALSASSPPPISASRVVPRLALIGGGLLALSAGFATSSRWMILVQELYGVQTGTVDPLFNRDIGFYLFKLPAIDGMLGG